jgi:hypothetical protein
VVAVRLTDVRASDDVDGDDGALAAGVSDGRRILRFTSELSVSDTIAIRIHINNVNVLKRGGNILIVVINPTKYNEIKNYFSLEK